MAGGVNEVQLVADAVFGGVVERDALRLDGDAAFTLQVHGVEHLRLHLALLEAAAHLDEAVRQGGLAVVDVGDDGEIANILHLGVAHRETGQAQGEALNR